MHYTQRLPYQLPTLDDHQTGESFKGERLWNAVYTLGILNATEAKAYVFSNHTIATHVIVIILSAIV
jgi:hypothetical protein